MFLEFIEQYIKDYMECNGEEYEITDEQLKEVIYKVANNDLIWETIDEMLYHELYKYEKKDIDTLNC